MGFSRQYWSGLPYPPPGNLPDPGIESISPRSSAGQEGSLPLAPLGRPRVPYPPEFSMLNSSKLSPFCLPTVWSGRQGVGLGDPDRKMLFKDSSRQDCCSRYFIQTMQNCMLPYLIRRDVIPWDVRWHNNNTIKQEAEDQQPSFLLGTNFLSLGQKGSILLNFLIQTRVTFLLPFIKSSDW